MKNFSFLLRFILWKKRIPKYNWEEITIEWLACSKDRANDLLSKDKEVISILEEEKIISFLNTQEEDSITLNENYELRGDISLANLNYLVQSNLGHGEKQLLAKALGVEANTVSRWINGTRKPSKADFSEIGTFFNVDSSFNLENDPLFLSYQYWGYLEMQQWLRKKCETGGRDLIIPLFPALRKLLN